MEVIPPPFLCVCVRPLRRGGRSSTFDMASSPAPFRLAGRASAKAQSRAPHAPFARQRECAHPAKTLVALEITARARRRARHARRESRYQRVFSCRMAPPDTGCQCAGTLTNTPIHLLAGAGQFATPISATRREESAMPKLGFANIITKA